MSSLIVNVCSVDEVIPHPNADKLEMVKIKGWRVITQKGQYAQGQEVVYFPPETVLPSELAERLGVKKYLAELPKNPDGTRPEGGRIRAARLRGEVSYGLVTAPDQDWEIGTNVADHYGVSKFDPPQPCTDGDAERPHSAFVKYTDIENYRNFPDIFKTGEEVAISEKLHGMCTRLGLIRVAADDGTQSWQFMCGSHEVNRKEYVTVQKRIKDPITDQVTGYNTYTRHSQFWDCLTDDVKELLKFLNDDEHNVIVFGELLGTQDIKYGVIFDFRVFDIMVDGKYMDVDAKMDVLGKFNVPHVPILYRGPFSAEKVEEYVDGPTTMCSPEKAGNFKNREGIVITPVMERTDDSLNGDQRVIFKAISPSYLMRKGGSEFH